MGRQKAKESTRNLATNRSALHQYHVLDRFEAGVALLGPEVKSIREGRINLKEAFVRIKRGEAWLVRAHVSPYRHAGHDTLDPVRPRKLLLHAREIRRIEKDSQPSGTTVVPLRAYLRHGRVKIEIAIVRGKKMQDKRETKKRKDAEREMARARLERG